MTYCGDKEEVSEGKQTDSRPPWLEIEGRVVRNMAKIIRMVLNPRGASEEVQRNQRGTNGRL